NEVKIASMLNFSYILNERNKIEFRNFLNQNGRVQTTVRNQFDAADQLNRVQYAQAYRSRTIYTSQVEGEHVLKNSKTKIGWLAGYGYSRKNEPDLRRASYYPDPTDPSRLAILPANNANDLTNGGRLFQSLNENSVMASLTINHKVNKKWRAFEFSEVDAGSYNNFLSRDFQARAFANTLQGSSKGGTFWNDTLQYEPLGQVYSQNNMNNGVGWTILEESNPTYKYHATNRLLALYVSGKFNIGSKIKLIAGLRNENNVQYIQSSIQAGQELSQSLPTNFLLPSVNFSYNFTPKSLFRLAYGKTLNRPEFREFAPFYYYDFDFNSVNYGSLYFGKTLNVCTIHNFDLRYEYYPSPLEMISVAVFYKHFTDPIEQVALATSGGNASALAYTFLNAQSAYNVGIELEARKNLVFISEKMKDFSLLFNASLIKSEVTIPSGQSDYWNETRSLQGQSPYMVNAGVYYQTEKSGWSASALYNTFGSRIVIVGNSNYPDVIETPRHQLDLSITKQLSSKVALNAGIMDVFNQPVTWVQDYNRDGKYQRNGTDNKMLTYKKGTVYTLMVRFTL
ncbi:MAG: TonB-dependent receptor, partial [Cytophagales bacterium]|nr:TonB-dependent receptor [Cytophaga sp.]